MKRTEPDTPRLAVSVEEAAKRTGIGRSLAYELVRTGKLPSVKLGGRVVVPLRALESMLNKETE